ncbi:hypothetical protein PPERSA_00657 [Pseudocohnilembus persalinus]|uniref:Uncharacterized protein n=1 Tax=Pseudocohnilembus persalinus TaxID=266149 RepID=A0A0V0QSV6_PSEPJ|nr:hypothetical protein PPERSA_00657 [Pseudocohnilembus persalinus]|eukprot:KRX05356.1 hypothetical protein PPERSA_00657 [Pseudocohnilembus persalinus]
MVGLLTGVVVGTLGVNLLLNSIKGGSSNKQNQQQQSQPYIIGSQQNQINDPFGLSNINLTQQQQQQQYNRQQQQQPQLSQYNQYNSNSSMGDSYGFQSNVK